MTLLKLEESDNLETRLPVSIGFSEPIKDRGPLETVDHPMHSRYFPKFLVLERITHVSIQRKRSRKT